MYDQVMVIGEAFAARRLDVHDEAVMVRVHRNGSAVHVLQFSSDGDLLRSYNFTVNNTSSKIKESNICADSLRRYMNNEYFTEIKVHTKIVDRIEENKPKELTFGDLSVLDAFRLVHNDDGRVYMKSNIKNSIVIKNSLVNHVGMHRAFHLGEKVERVDLTLVVG